MFQRNRFADVAVGLIFGLGIALLVLVWAVPEFRDPTYWKVADQSKGQLIGIISTEKDTLAQWIAAFAAIASVAASVLAIVLVARTFVETRKATNAAVRSSEIAEQMLLGVERPHLFVDNVIPTVPVEDKWFDLPENKIPLFELRFDTINFGRTPAIVSEMKTGILLGPLPAVPRFFPGEVHQSEWVISPDGGRRTGIAFIREIVTHAKLNEMWISQTYIEGREPHHIWFYGTVLYESVNGSKDEIGFIYRYLPHGKSFHLENIPGYTFRRRDVRQR